MSKIKRPQRASVTFSPNAVPGLKKHSTGKNRKQQFTAAGLALAGVLFICGPEAAYPGTITLEGDTETLYNVGIITGVAHANGDYYEYNHPDRNLVINWDVQRRGSAAPIRNTSVTAKSLTMNSTSGTDQWSNKGIFTDCPFGGPFREIYIKVSENIDITSGHYTIFSDPGKIHIEGFKNLTARSASTAENSGYVVSNVSVNGLSSAISIVGTEDSTISLISEKSSNPAKLRSVVEDASTEGILVKGGTVNVKRIADENQPLVEIGHHTVAGGSIDIEGSSSVNIGSDTNQYAVESKAKAAGTSNIWINKSSAGVVKINGRIVAESGAVTVNYAGDGSVQSGDVISQNNPGAANSGSVILNYAGANSVMTGSITASSTASVSAGFSGKNSSMTGNITAGDSSTVSQTLSGVNAKMTGDIAADGSSSITAELSGENTSITGNITAGDSSTVSQTLSGVNAKMTGDIAAAGSSSITAELSGENTSMNGNITASDSSTANFRASGRNSLLNGTVTASGGTVSARFTGSGSGWNGDLVNTGGTADISLTSASWYGNMNAQSGTTNLALDSGSTWTGAADTASGAQASVTISSGAAWNVTADSSLTSLVLSAGGHLSMEGAANKLRIGSLTAPAAVFGTLHMDLVYHDNNLSTYENASDSDFLYVDSGSGATFLVEPTRSSTLNDMSDGDRLYFAQTGIGSSAFQVNQEILLMNSNRLYDKNLLVKNDQNTTADGYEDWYLTTNTEHEPDGDELNPNGRVPGSAYTAALAVWRDSDTLLKRLGELRYSREEQGTWARYSRRKLEKEHDHTFTTKLNALQIGYDTKRTGEKGDWYYGAAVEHVWGDSDYDYGFGYGNGDTKMTDLTLYGTSLRRSGHYLDLAARVGRIDSDYEVTYGDGGDTGDFDNWAFSIGAEYGRKSSLGKDWYWEWQSQLTYSYVWGDSYTTANGARISQDNFDSLVGRLGLVLSREFNTDSATPGRVYAKASLQHEFLGDSSERLYDGVIFYDSEDLDDTWYTVGFGANLKLSGNCDLYLDAERDFDAVIKNKYRFECGVRFEF